MPTIGIKQNLLMKALGVEYSEEEFNDLCFEYGLELDEVTTEKEMIGKEQGDERSAQASDELIYKIDIPANRYDLLCLSGLAQALLIFQNKIPIPKYCSVRSKDPESLKILVQPNTKFVRPIVVAAILRNITLDSSTYESFIDLQDKLHQNICRKRSIVAIGTHDLDKVKGPFYYDAKKPEEIKFKPLNETKEFTASELMDHYSVNSHLKPYLPIIQDKQYYPVIYDSNDVVLSLPPIINGHHSKITLSTKNILIECTATDEHKAKIVLDTIICMFSQYCNPQFQGEQIEIVYQESGERKFYPKLHYRKEEVSASKINKLLNISKTPKEICQILAKMGLKSSPSPSNSDMIDVIIPPTRHDILHACDILEDVAIAYGYNNIEKTIPKVVTIGSQFFLNKLTDQLRHEISRCGYTEALTFSLCSLDDIGLKMRSPSQLDKAVRISNPKTAEFQIARTSLLPGLLRTIESNKKMPLPLKIFEISDVVLKDPDRDVGACNKRMLCAVHYNKQPGFEIIHGLLDRLMEVLEIIWTPQQSVGYYIESVEDERFLPGRCAAIICHDKKIGILGVLHPDVVLNFALTQPCSALEIDIEFFLSIFSS